MSTPTEKNIGCDCDVIHTDVVENAKSHLLEDNTINKLADFFKVFGDSTRVRILWALDKNEMCVCDLAYLLDMTKSAVSHQLKVLRTSNLLAGVKREKMFFTPLQMTM